MTSQAKLDNLADSFVESIIMTPNDEFLAEFIEAGGDMAECERLCKEALEHALAARKAGNATVTDRFPDTTTPRVDVRDLIAQLQPHPNEKLRAMWARYKAIKSNADHLATGDLSHDFTESP